MSRLCGLFQGFTVHILCPVRTYERKIVSSGCTMFTFFIKKFYFVNDTFPMHDDEVLSRALCNPIHFADFFLVCSVEESYCVATPRIVLRTRVLQRVTSRTLHLINMGKIHAGRKFVIQKKAERVRFLVMLWCSSFSLKIQKFFGSISTIT